MLAKLMTLCFNVGGRQVTVIAFCPSGTPFDRKVVKNLVTIVSNNFPEVVHRICVFPTGWATSMIWGVAKYFFDSQTRQKVVLLEGGRRPPRLKDFVDPSMCFEEFGGTMNNEAP